MFAWGSSIVVRWASEPASLMGEGNRGGVGRGSRAGRHSTLQGTAVCAARHGTASSFTYCLPAAGSPSPGAECGVLLQRLEAERLSKEKQLSVQTLQERHPGCAAAFAGRGCLQQDMTLPSLIQAPCNGLPYPPSAAGEGKAAARCLQAWCAEDSSSGLPDCINAPHVTPRHCRWALKCHNGLAVWAQ